MQRPFPWDLLRTDLLTLAVDLVYRPTVQALDSGSVCSRSPRSGETPLAAPPVFLSTLPAPCVPDNCENTPRVHVKAL